MVNMPMKILRSSSNRIKTISWKNDKKGIGTYNCVVYRKYREVLTPCVFLWIYPLRPRKFKKFKSRKCKLIRRTVKKKVCVFIFLFVVYNITKFSWNNFFRIFIKKITV